MEPDSLNNNLSYASEMFDYLFIKNSEARPADFDAVAAKIETQAKLALNYSPEAANLILAQLYYNQGYSYTEQANKIKGPKPEDIKKKKDLNASAVAKYDLAIPYTEKEVSLLEQKGTALKGKDKNTLRTMYGILEDIYTAKGDKAKAGEYDKKYASMK